ncbi:MAG: bifunctional diaminohydroxyphosphoribosylaminopyrimidine deaminase/5-amino-6-(5-phosphoribosylamino)uracil reductase RibD [Chthoniobacteraceae bacterium]|nr:bifunctional diaminohydroxyphosphoribosylaminopyrimidine deaminase/5-amino-6-(5-phosphoribosylamino)uracil reductase RibD [Chthoniobacteraceae bacterium]
MSDPAFPESFDERFLQAALAEARRGVGRTSPNPAVGAVIVRGGEGDEPGIVGSGWHHRAGMPHAEVEALRSLSDPSRARGATLYVTLEPCSTQGRTPPCTRAILEAGIGRVVIGTLDPNPAHAGRGVEILRAGGVEVRVGVLEEECRRLNLAFNHWIVTRMPWVIAKAGMSLDGRISRAPGESRWITNEASRADTHQLRARVDAILVGGGTLRADNPQLTVRGLPPETMEGRPQPWRVIVSQTGNLPPEAAVFTDEHRDRTLVFTGRPLREVLADLGRRNVTSVLIEGGMRVLGEAFDERLVNQVCFYVAPLLLGGPVLATGGLGVGSSAEAPRIVNPAYERFGDDVRMTGEVEYPMQ